MSKIEIGDNLTFVLVIIVLALIPIFAFIFS